MQVVRPGEDSNEDKLAQKLKEDYQQMKEANAAYVQAMKDNPVFFMSEPMITPLIQQQEAAVKGFLTGACPPIIQPAFFSQARTEFLTKIQEIYKEQGEL